MPDIAIHPASPRDDLVPVSNVLYCVGRREIPVEETAMADPISPFRRRNSNLAEIVQFGITLQTLGASKEALRYLVSKGVDQAVIDRVLAPGRARRFIAH